MKPSGKHVGTKPKQRKRMDFSQHYSVQPKMLQYKTEATIYMPASEERKTNPYPNTNIKPLSNRQGIHCVPAMQAQWVWTPAMCSVQHKRDNLRSWPSSKQTLWLLLWSQSVCFRRYNKQHRQPVSSVSCRQVDPNTASPLHQPVDGLKEADEDGDTAHRGGTGWFNMFASNWAHELELNTFDRNKKKRILK